MSGREYLLKYTLDIYFGDDIAKLISEYDYYLDGYIINSYGSGSYNFLTPMNDGKFILNNAESKSIEIYDTKNKTRTPEIILTTIDYNVANMIFVLSNNTIIISHFVNKKLEIFYPDNQGNHNRHDGPDYIIKRHDKSIFIIEEFPNNIYCMGTHNKTIEIWYNLEQQKPDYIFNTHEYIRSLTALENNYLASGGKDSIVNIWDLEKKICKFSLKGDFIAKAHQIICIDEYRLLAVYSNKEKEDPKEQGFIIWDYQRGIKINSLIYNFKAVNKMHIINNKIYSVEEFDVEKFKETGSFSKYGIRIIDIDTLESNTMGEDLISKFDILPNGDIIYMTDDLGLGLGILNPITNTSRILIGFTRDKYQITVLSNGRCLVYNGTMIYVIA